MSFSFFFFLLFISAIAVDKERIAHLKEKVLLNKDDALSSTDPTPFLSNKKNEIIVMAYCSRPRLGFCKTMESSLYNNISVTLLGWRGRPSEEILPEELQWCKNKVIFPLEYTKNLDPDTIILFFDAYDVLFNAGLDEILKRWNIFESSYFETLQSTINEEGKTIIRHPVLFAGESAGSQVHYGAINTGVFMGRVRALTHMWEDVIARYKLNPIERAEQFIMHIMYNDQKVSKYYNPYFEFVLDSRNTMFQCLHSLQSHIKFSRIKKKYDSNTPEFKSQRHLLPHYLQNSRWHIYNWFSKSTPLIFHFNGDGKDDMTHYTHRVWYAMTPIKKKDGKKITGDEEWESLSRSRTLERYANTQFYTETNSILLFGELCPIDDENWSSKFASKPPINPHLTDPELEMKLNKWRQEVKKNSIMPFIKYEV